MSSNLLEKNSEPSGAHADELLLLRRIASQFRWETEQPSANSAERLKSHASGNLIFFVSDVLGVKVGCLVHYHIEELWKYLYKQSSFCSTSFDTHSVTLLC